MTAEPATRPATAMALFPSLASIRAAHRELLKQHREVGNSPEVLAALDDFIWRVRASGALLDQDADRQAAQSLLDYWSTRLYRLDHEVPDAILAEFDPSLSPDLPDSLNPYVGLEAFQENNQGAFFGRQKLIESLIEHLRNNRLLALVGPSGSGKSSAVRAGLASALKDGALPGSDQWLYMPSVMPGSQPLVTLSRLAAQISGDTSGRLQPQAAFLRNPSQLLQSATRDVVVIVDQFEEVFTLCGDDRVRTAFVNNLLGLVQAPGANHVVILTMRTDFEGQVARLPDFEPLFQKALERVTPLNASEIREAIEGPANLVGLKFEEGIVEALINDVLGEPAALPLLQFTLLKLWEARERNRVTWAAYRRLGGGRQALSNSADAFYRQLIPEDQVTARRILLRLVRPGEGLEVTSNRIQRGRLYYKAEARDRVDRVLDKLIQARLLHRTPGETNADDQIEVAHEALVRNWPTLIAWLEEERQHIRERNRLTTAAEQWQLRGRDASALWRGALLEEAAHYTDLNELESEFIAAGQAVLAAAAAAERAAHERELDAARKLAGAEKQRAETEKQRAEEQAQSASRLRRFNRLLTGVGALALLAAAFAFIFALAAAFFGVQSSKNAASAQQSAATAQSASTQAVAQKGIAVDERDRADAQAQLALARQLSAQSAALSAYQLDLSLLLGLEANRITNTVETRSSLLSALSLSSQLQARLGDHEGTVAGVAFSPKDNLLASASYDRSIILWDANGDHFVSRNPTDCGCPVTSVAFSPDGKILAAGSDKQVFLLSNLNSSKPDKITLTDYPNWVRTVAFSPDGKLVAGAGDDNSIYVWDVASQKVVGGPLTGDTALIWSIAFSPDGSLLASGSQDGSLRLWDVASRKQMGQPVATQATPVLAVAFSPDGATLASGGGDNMIWLWDVKSRKAIGDPLAVHSAPVRAVAFSPDGATLASGSEDTTVAMWDVATHALLGQPLIGHTGRVATVAFSPDGKRLASGSEDDQVILWDVIARSQLRQVISGGNGLGLSVAFKPSSQDLVLAASGDRKIELWNLASTPPASQSLQDHTALVAPIVFSPDGAWLASNSCAKSSDTGCTQGEIFVWDMTADPPAIQQRLDGSASGAAGMAFSADSKRLVAATLDNAITFWDVASGQAAGDPVTRYQAPVDSLALSPDGHWLAVGRHEADAGKIAGTIDIWDLSANPPHMSESVQQAHASAVLTLAFSPNGKLLASAGGDRKIVVWDVSNPSAIKPIQSLYGHVRAINSVAFSPDGALLASGSDDKSVILWDVASGSLVGRPLIGHAAAVKSVAFSPNGQWLASGGADGTVNLWNLDLGAWQKQACQQAGRNLSQAEWAQFFGSARYHQTCEQWPAGS